MNKKTWLLVVTLAPVCLTACLLAAGEPRENCAESHDPRNTRTLQICTDKSEYDFGEPIYITFTVTNISDEPLVWNGGDEPAVDIHVEGEYWSDEQELIIELTQVTLQPGESHTIEWTWPTSQTDLEPLANDFLEEELLSIHIFGTEISHPGASGGAVWVKSYYRRP